MSDSPVDLRSDTLTRPTPAMREAMARAAVGDDVFGEDPTVRLLQERLADTLGKEAALFVPSGTMSNQIGIRVHCRLGDELLCEAQCHIHNYEQGGAAQLSGVATRTVEGRYGVVEPVQLSDLPRGADNPHYAPTRLVCLENTHNRGGGRILPSEGLEAIGRWAHGAGLAMHLDGARLFNAVVATGIEARRWAAPFDTVSVCFSKGLGAPVGSALAGTRDMIADATRHRKVLGGGMRQVGIIAAGALFALEHHVERLSEDHQHAQLLAQAIRAIDGLELRPPDVDTNIVIFHVAPEWGTAAQFVAQAAARGLLVHPFGSQLVRAVTHLDVDRAGIERAIHVLADVMRGTANAPAPGVADTAAPSPGRSRSAYA